MRDSDIRRTIEDLKPKLGDEIEDILQGKVEIAKMDGGDEIILVDEEPLLVETDEKMFPFLNFADRLELKRVTVDMGAVKHISDGADIMAPGIVEADEDIREGEIVVIDDEENRKPLAIGLSLKKGSELKGKQGKVVKNIHFVGDNYWDLKEEI